MGSGGTKVKVGMSGDEINQNEELGFMVLSPSDPSGSLQFNQRVIRGEDIKFGTASFAKF